MTFCKDGIFLYSSISLTLDAFSIFFVLVSIVYSFFSKHVFSLFNKNLMIAFSHAYKKLGTQYPLHHWVEQR